MGLSEIKTEGETLINRINDTAIIYIILAALRDTQGRVSHK